MRRLTVSRAEKGAKRPRVKPLWHRPQVVAGGVLLAIVGAASGAWWVWQAGHVQRGVETVKWSVISAAAKAGFVVGDILVQGRVRTSPEELRAALRLERGAPILAFDPAAARARLEALPWVRNAGVERQLPDVVHLRIVERQPLAIWQHDGVFSLIDSEGTEVPIKRLDGYRRLVVVVGADAPREAPKLFAILGEEPELASRVEAAVRISDRRWNLHLKGGVTIRLPETDPSGAWQRLARLNQNHALLGRALATVDLRYPDRVIVRPVQQDAPMATPMPARKPSRKPGTET